MKLNFRPFFVAFVPVVLFAALFILEKAHAQESTIYLKATLDSSGDRVLVHRNGSLEPILTQVALSVFDGWVTHVLSDRVRHHRYRLDFIGEWTLHAGAGGHSANCKMP